MRKHAMGWKQLRTSHPVLLERQRLAFRNKVMGALLMGSFGAFTATLFFLGVCAK